MHEKLNEPLSFPYWAEGSGRFNFSVRPYEIRNALGALIGMADEYLVQFENGTTVRLYKTGDGNWYEPGENENNTDPALARKLRTTLEQIQ